MKGILSTGVRGARRRLLDDGSLDHFYRAPEDLADVLGY